VSGFLSNETMLRSPTPQCYSHESGNPPLRSIAGSSWTCPNGTAEYLTRFFSTGDDSGCVIPSGRNPPSLIQIKIMNDIVNDRHSIFL